ncbi:MAG: YcxB family protein [Flammeovirgaceae bacterium]
MLYRKLSIRLFTGVWVFSLLISIPTLLNSSILDTWTQFLFLFALVFGLPLFTYLSAKTNYKSNKRISETITYEFNDDTIITTGESFNAKLTWEKIYSVTENKNWILIWQNKQVANVIPKRDFLNNDLNKFKEIVRKQKGFKNKLK